MPELELIKLARHISTVWSLLAFLALLVILFATKVLGTASPTPGGRDSVRSGSGAFRIAVLNRVVGFGIVVVVVGLFVKVLPLFAFRDTPVHGVVLRKGAQTTVSAAQISLDGLSELGTTTDNNGNFQLRVPAGRRQDNYTVRAQLGGEGGVANITDTNAPKAGVRIELPPPADYGWTTVNIPPGWSLRAVLQRLADGDKATIVYGSSCTATLLNSKVRAGELRARTTAAVMEELPRRLVRPSSLQITATRGADGGHYEVNCSR